MVVQTHWSLSIQLHLQRIELALNFLITSHEMQPASLTLGYAWALPTVYHESMLYGKR
jgi:hypothetical protein